MAAPIIPPTHPVPAQPHYEIYWLPHAAQIIYAGMFLSVLALLLWRHHVAFVKGCTCQKDRGTFLKPKWKKYGKDGRE